ncbi:hypothetical protein M422DRAFT_181913 [Sphaerobolus stellatus SS14]|uniref:Major facilitator superfamily (MFS) profile domain-containing protein n=1 Tax=Sphaerobolus stellatus (strain SS14) TaxID=990650 RepID=A0A0C9UI89_SPHS4|nr:hypothetical protein M422DRAFT_181913 [Sphaerobolus stellatus SS14]
MSHEYAPLLIYDNGRIVDTNPDEETLEVPPIPDEQRPFPWRSLIFVFMFTMVHPLLSETVFPFVNQMLLDIGVADKPEDAGWYSGVIDQIADIYGRRPVILGGIAGLAISIFVFGLSRSFAAMVIARCLGGGIGGAYAATKVMVGELTDRSNQAAGYQWHSVAHRLGQTLSGPLSGYLSHPDRRFPGFQSKFWKEYPFALPGFVAGSIGLCAVAVGYFYLEEVRFHI